MGERVELRIAVEQNHRSGSYPPLEREGAEPYVFPLLVAAMPRLIYREIFAGKRLKILNLPLY